MACPLEGTQSALSCFCDPNDRVTLINGATRRVRPDEGPARREALGCWSQPGSGSSGSALNRTLCGVGAGNRTVPCSARDSYLQPRVRALAVTGVVRQTLAPADSAQAPGAGVSAGELQASVRSKAQREGPSLCQGARVPLPGPRPAVSEPPGRPGPPGRHRRDTRLGNDSRLRHPVASAGSGPGARNRAAGCRGRLGDSSQVQVESWATQDRRRAAQGPA